jgi:endonuclease/exonuclease/phosphatase family metal-dependent hydrolase
MRLQPFLFAVFALLLTTGGCGGAGDIEPNESSSDPSTEADAYPSQPARIYVDESADDWDSLSVRAVDPDGQATNIQRLWVAHSQDRLFLHMVVQPALNLQEGNDLTLYLDTDNDPSTGTQALGVGAELTWTFGERSGKMVRNGAEQEVSHADIGLTTLPTVRSDTFEVALDRSAAPGGTPLFAGDSLRIALSSPGDRLPNANGGLGYALTASEVPLAAPGIERPPASALRLLSYNSVNNFDRNRSAIFDPERQPSYRRIFAAVSPDVIAFQEVYSESAAETEAVAESELGLSDAWTWAKHGADLVLGSRFPILDSEPIPGYESNRSAAFLLDADAALGSPLLVINMHPPCCNFGPDEDDPSRNAQRQQVVDNVVAFLRDLKQGEGPFALPENTPIVVMGDMNFVGEAQQPRTLRTGQIVNTDRFGPPAPPDWDGSSLLDTAPRQVASPLHTTWVDMDSSFPPGRLDYAFVTDSVLEVVHEFVLHTPAMPADLRDTYGLRASDTPTASDHLPVVLDVAPR